MSGLRRRSVLGLLATLAARPGLGATFENDDLLARICGRAAGHADLAALGRAQCALRPGPSRAAWLGELARTLPAEARRGEAELVEALRLQAMADFRAGRVVSLDGWRVSLTEARICAAAVAAPDPAIG
jgi:hypothetical protein